MDRLIRESENEMCIQLLHPQLTKLMFSGPIFVTKKGSMKNARFVNKTSLKVTKSTLMYSQTVHMNANCFVNFHDTCVNRSAGYLSLKKNFQRQHLLKIQSASTIINTNNAVESHNVFCKGIHIKAVA